MMGCSDRPGLVKRRGLLRSAPSARGVPMAKPVVDVAVGHVDRWSVTFPSAHTLRTSAILLSPSHAADPVRLAEVGAHGCGFGGAIISATGGGGWRTTCSRPGCAPNASRRGGRPALRAAPHGRGTSPTWARRRVLLAGVPTQAGDGLFARRRRWRAGWNDAQRPHAAPTRIAVEAHDWSKTHARDAIVARRFA